MRPSLRIGGGLAFMVIGVAIIYAQFATGGLVQRVGVGPILILVGLLAWALKAFIAAAFPTEPDS